MTMIPMKKHSTLNLQRPTSKGAGRRVPGLLGVEGWLLNVPRSPLCCVVLLAVLAGGFSAAAQSNNVAGPADYAAFSRFITERNIFDPNRSPRNAPDNRPRTTARQTRAQLSAPAFTLVGTMSYQKGLFAFFDGNNADLRKVLPASGGIAGYTVTEVTLTGVKLQAAGKTNETVRLKIGDMMRQEAGRWQPAGPGELSAGTNAAGSEASGADTGSAAAPAGASNDILKKLMQQREQELK